MGSGCSAGSSGTAPSAAAVAPPAAPSHRPPSPRSDFLPVLAKRVGEQGWQDEANEQCHCQRLPLMIFPTDHTSPHLTPVSEPKSLNYTAECTHSQSLRVCPRNPSRRLSPPPPSSLPRPRQPSLAPSRCHRRHPEMWKGSRADADGHEGQRRGKVVSSVKPSALRAAATAACPLRWPCLCRGIPSQSLSRGST